ncbi:MAG: Unknown protein [uncultured Sulfurovum sp.]|uniref:DUF3298 domain-containing protein n=1 Tax=uncultured Sulfurovum sp. TaxID=269237 RepID=A0A6S6SG24_9BACT|nr:MAG: Unknown protein [uncultured Sulfurovum sp.]
MFFSRGEMLVNFFNVQNMIFFDFFFYNFVKYCYANMINSQGTLMNIKTLPLLLLFSLNTLVASTVSTTLEKSTHKFCKNTLLSDDSQKEVDFCMETKTEYPKVSSTNKTLEKHLRQAIEKELKTQNSPKSHVLKEIKEGNVASAMGHESSLNIKVLSATDKTFTLEGAFYAYLGGAHGMGNTIFINYDSKTGKEIGLKDVFVPNYQKKLKEIVEQEYRIQNHITQSDSLKEKLDWFDNKFLLAKAIGFGEDGLHLAYNAYEIKAYAYGTTNIIVPYTVLKSLIKPNGYLSPLLKAQKLSEGKVQHSFSDALSNMNLSAERIAGSKVKLMLQVNKDPYNYRMKAKKGSISLSFPQLSNKSEILSKSSQNIDKLMLYPKGHKIYNLSQKKNIVSEYLLVEGEVAKWTDEKERKIELILKMPENIDSLKVHYRMTLRNGKQFFNTPYKGTQGQQGFENYDIEIQ